MEPTAPYSRSTVLLRRLRTIGSAVILLVVLTAVFPVLVAAAAVVDAVRAVRSRRPWMGVRLVAVIWLFLAAVVAELVVLGVVWLAAGFGRRRAALTSGTRRVDHVASALLLEALEALFRLEVERPAWEQAGPLVLLVRHAGYIDTLLPNALLARPARMRMRYVLSSGLLSNPLVDVWGHRLRNVFVHPAADPAVALAEIAALGADLDADEAVVLFPEGARFTAQRRDRILASLQRRDPAAAARARDLERVLPPHAAGTLALLDGAAGADVVVLAHTGLEDFGDLRRLWQGDVVGRRVRVEMWRIARSEVPMDVQARTRWLWDLWSRLDSWIEAESAP